MDENLICNPEKASRVIDATFLKFLECLENGELMNLEVPKYDQSSFLDAYNDSIDEVRLASSEKSLDNSETAKSYAQLFSVMSIVKELIEGGRTISQRDVYYSLKHLFRKQSECNSCILELGRLLGLRRFEMNIIPVSRGFVCGLMRYRFVSSVLDVSANASSTSTAEADCGYSQWIDCSNTLMHPNGVSIAHYWTNINYFYCNSQHGQVDENSNVHDTETDVETVTTKDTNASVSLNSPQIEVEIQIATNVVAIVVIEKEGIFHHLCEDRFFDRVPCVLVTGCGYPDHATRALVSRLSSHAPHLPVLGVCDYNPHGLSLLLTYRFSCQSSRLEGYGNQAPLRWLGMRSVHVRRAAEIYYRRNSNNSSNDTTTTTKNCRNQGIEAEDSTDHSSTASSFSQPSLIDHAHNSKLFQTLTQLDIKLIKRLLHSDELQQLPEKYGEELIDMLQGGVKCELEMMYSIGLAAVSDFLSHTIGEKDYL